MTKIANGVSSTCFGPSGEKGEDCCTECIHEGICIKVAAIKKLQSELACPITISFDCDHHRYTAMAAASLEEIDNFYMDQARETTI